MCIIYMINDIVKKYINDEPLYIIDLNKVKEQYIYWMETLPNIKPFYAVKCNPNKEILLLLESLNCNFDCASKKEIEQILNIAKEPNRIIYANPCKQQSYITFAKNNDVSLMTFDSIEELIKINKIYPNARLVLRIAVDDSYSLCKFNSKFGCSLDILPEIIIKIKELNATLCGVSFHVGSSCSNPVVYYDAIKKCKLIYDYALNNHINIEIIDIGGGFTSNKTMFKNIADNIKHAINEFFYDININFIAEPGRFFVENSHTLILCVIAKKVLDNKINYYLNDGVYGSFNCIYYDHQQPLLKSLNNTTTKIKKSTFFGPTCDSMDVIYKNIDYPELEVGDYLYIDNFGAYTSSPSTSFNGFNIENIRYLR